MLQPGLIPDKEPDIRVGIILPEDEYTSVAISNSQKMDYQIEYQGKIVRLAPDTDLFVKLHQNHLLLKMKGSDFKSESEFRIYPVNTQNEAAPGSGLLVKNVVSGRDFHWKKQINVFLPGTIIVKKYKSHLILINELPIEHYLMCVATSEMGSACPPALIEAQTIAARSWMLANIEQKHIHLGMDVCNDDCCQRYQGSTFLTDQSIKGAMDTYGQVLLYNNQICDARYSKSCGGVMESFDTIWEGENPPYFQVKADAENDPEEWKKPLSDESNFKKWIESVPETFCSPHVIPENELKKYLGSVDEEGTYFRWQEEINQADIVKNINHFHSLHATAITALEPIYRGGSGRIAQMSVHYIDAKGQNNKLTLKNDFEIRQNLHPKFLYSSAFIIIPLKVKDNIPGAFRFKGAGWGHGAGLCQIGALGMALQKYSAEDIVMHYYPGSKLKKIY